jgi:hypothetical protein
MVCTSNLVGVINLVKLAPAVKSISRKNISISRSTYQVSRHLAVLETPRLLLAIPDYDLDCLVRFLRRDRMSLGSTAEFMQRLGLHVTILPFVEIYHKFDTTNRPFSGTGSRGSTNRTTNIITWLRLWAVSLEVYEPL